MQQFHRSDRLAENVATRSRRFFNPIENQVCWRTKSFDFIILFLSTGRNASFSANNHACYCVTSSIYCAIVWRCYSVLIKKLPDANFLGTDCKIVRQIAICPCLSRPAWSNPAGLNCTPPEDEKMGHKERTIRKLMGGWGGGEVQKKNIRAREN